jgi:hypothetical protein
MVARYGDGKFDPIEDVRDVVDTFDRREEAVGGR